jgi:hypothetical protein
MTKDHVSWKSLFNLEELDVELEGRAVSSVQDSHFTHSPTMVDKTKRTHFLGIPGIFWEPYAKLAGICVSAHTLLVIHQHPLRNLEGSRDTHSQPPLTADIHTHQTLVPALDDLSTAEDEREGFTGRVGVELLAVGELADVSAGSARTLREDWGVAEVVGERRSMG